MRLYINTFFLMLFSYSVHAIDVDAMKQILPIKDWNSYILNKSTSEEILHAADLGNSSAMWILAASYEYGINNFNQDYSKSMLWNKKLLTTKKKSEGNFGIASLYARGKGTTQNIKLARKHLLEVLNILTDKGSPKKVGTWAAFAYFVGGKDFDSYKGLAAQAKAGDLGLQLGLVYGYARLLEYAGINGNNRNKLLLKLTDSEKVDIGNQLQFWVNQALESKNESVMLLYADMLIDSHKYKYPFKTNKNQGLQLLKRVAETCNTENDGAKNSARTLGVFYGPDGHFNDYISSYKWFNIGKFLGSWISESYMEDVAKLMTPEQIVKAQSESRNWLNTHCL